MATQVKAAPIQPNEARHFNGKSVTAVTVTLGAALGLTASDKATGVAGDFGPNGVIQKVYEVLQENATPIIIGQVKDLATGEFDVYFEGDFTERDDYGTGSDTFVADLATRIIAIGSVVIDAETAAITGETAGTVSLAAASAAVIADLAAREAGNVGLVGDGGVTV